MTDTFGKPAQPRILSRREIDRKLQRAIKTTYASLLDIELQIHRLQGNSLETRSSLVSIRNNLASVIKYLKEIRK